MTADERRASTALASVFALRMLGLFLVLPVFALEAGRLPGGDDPARGGVAMPKGPLPSRIMDKTRQCPAGPPPSGQLRALLRAWRR